MNRSDVSTSVFESLRGRLFGLAYRMLGSSGDAEDIVQEAYLRWHQAERERIENPEAWLVTTTSRLAIDRLRRLKTEREPPRWTGRKPPCVRSCTARASGSAVIASDSMRPRPRRRACCGSS